MAACENLSDAALLILEDISEVAVCQRRSKLKLLLNS